MSKLLEWAAMSQQLKALRIQEAELRRDLCATIIGDTQMVNGRVTVKGEEAHHSYKAVQTLSYKVDPAILQNILSHLDPIEKAAIKWKPDLALAAYKKLPDDSLLHEAISTSMSMPTLSVEELY